MRCGVSVSVNEHAPICFISNREPIRFLTAQKASDCLSHLPSGKATETSPSLNLGVPTRPLYDPFPSNPSPPVGIPPEGLKTYPARDGCRAEVELCRSKNCSLVSTLLGSQRNWSCPPINTQRILQGQATRQLAAASLPSSRIVNLSRLS